MTPDETKATLLKVQDDPDYIIMHPLKIAELLDDMVDTIDRLQRQVKEEEEYREYVKKNKIRGYCCGYLTRQDLSQVIAHHSAEQYEKEKIELRKLMNNPALSEAAKKTLNRALWMITIGLFDRNKIEADREKEGMK